jgi:hypothetical protein
MLKGAIHAAATMGCVIFGELMMSILKRAAIVAAAGALALCGGLEPVYAAGPRSAADAQAAGGACYQVSQGLYGPFVLTFCLTDRGSYTVTGAGYNCKGGLDWNASGRNVQVQLQFSRCGKGLAWSADAMSCRAMGFAGSMVPTPGRPAAPLARELVCNYVPGFQGFKPVRVRAHRI